MNTIDATFSDLIDRAKEDGADECAECLSDDNKKIIHSRKPAVVRDMLSEMWPGCEQVELFATEQVPGWEGYGYDLGNRVEDFFLR